MSVRAAKRPGTANGPISVVRAAPWQEAVQGEIRNSRVARELCRKCCAPGVTGVTDLVSVDQRQTAEALESFDFS
jgi:hypothetical protein